MHHPQIEEVNKTIRVIIYKLVSLVSLSKFHAFQGQRRTFPTPESPINTSLNNASYAAPVEPVGSASIFSFLFFQRVLRIKNSFFFLKTEIAMKK
jgi:hypothetical protein